MDRLLMNNTMLRVIAIILAVALWLGVHAPNSGATGASNGIGISQQFPKAIQVEAPHGFVVTSVEPSRGAVVVNASVQDLPGLPAKMLGVTLVADARGLTAGTHQIHVAALNMPALHSSSFSVQPSLVTVTLAPAVTRSFNVTVDVQGSPQSGYSLGQASTDVAAVQVSGAQGDVSRVARVIANVSVASATQTVTHIANLIPVDAKGNPVPNVTTSPVNCTVTVPVNTPAETAQIQPEVVGLPAGGYAIAGLQVTPGTVQVTGTIPTQPNGGPLQIQLPVDVTGLQSTRTLQVPVPLQNGVQNASPASVAVTVKVEKSLSRTFTGVPIQIQHASTGETVKLPSTHTVNLTVSGPQSVVSALTANNLTVYIDASTLANNSTSATIEVLVPAWVQVTQLSQRTATVTVSGAAH